MENKSIIRTRGKQKQTWFFSTGRYFLFLWINLHPIGGDPITVSPFFFLLSIIKRGKVFLAFSQLAFFPSSGPIYLFLLGKSPFDEQFPGDQVPVIKNLSPLSLFPTFPVRRTYFLWYKVEIWNDFHLQLIWFAYSNLKTLVRDE